MLNSWFDVTAESIEAATCIMQHCTFCTCIAMCTQHSIHDIDELYCMQLSAEGRGKEWCPPVCILRAIIVLSILPTTLITQLNRVSLVVAPAYACKLKRHIIHSAAFFPH